jgi:hypothetical protein
MLCGVGFSGQDENRKIPILETRFARAAESVGCPYLSKILFENDSGGFRFPEIVEFRNTVPATSFAMRRVWRKPVMPLENRRWSGHLKMIVCPEQHRGARE